MRIALAIAMACFSIAGVTRVSEAQAAVKQLTNIPAQQLGSALQALAKDRSLQVVYVSEEVDTVRTAGAVGELTVDEALKQLLSGTGLVYLYLDDKTITVQPELSVAPLSYVRMRQSRDASPAGLAQDAPWEGVRLAQVDQNTRQQGSATTGATSSGAGNSEPASGDKGDTSGDRGANLPLEQVVVTAQKRLERLQDVPVPVTALNTSAMVEQGKTRLEDYFTNVPGLSYNRQGMGQQSVAIRGLATATIANPTVAASIDDVPVGSSTFMGRGSTSYPDIDPSDLARIEVLRGPQGTLYGASSIGGLLKFVTVDASTERYSGQVQLSSSAIEQGDTGYGASGSVNVPVSDNFAIRGSAFTRRDPGYVDNIRSGKQDVDQTDRHGGHLAALWRLSDAVTLKLSGFYQKNESDGSAQVDTIVGGLRQASLPKTQWFRDETQIYSAVLTADLGPVDLTSVTGYSTTKGTDTWDFSTLVVQSGGFDIFGVTGGTFPEFYRTRRFTQELRLASAVGQKFEWLAGMFFDDERSPSHTALISNDEVTGDEVGRLADYDVLSTLKEYSVFGDLTVNFTDRFDVQLGGREAKIKQSYAEVDTGILAGPAIPTANTDASAFTYLLTPRFKVSNDLMVYARFASGYRPGGANVTGFGPDTLQIPGRFEPDRAYNYELGAKGALLNGMLSFDASIYYIDWKNVQIQISNNLIFYRDNVGSARSKGAEFSAQMRPTRGLTVSLALALNDALLTADFPPEAASVGKAGDRLPFSSKFAGSLSLNQQFALSASVEGTVGVAVSYIGERLGEFPVLFDERIRLPSYTTLDLTSGVSVDSWSVDLFLNNVANRRGLVGGGVSASTAGSSVIYVQPRTVGLSVTKTF